MIFGFKAAPAKEKQEPQQASLATRLRQGLRRTQSTLLDGLGDLFPGEKSIDEDFLETLEEHLLIADLGINATTKIIDALSDRLKRSDKQDPAVLKETLNQLMCEILQPVNQPFVIPKPVTNRPFVILMVGVNGVGKTTCVGKLAKHLINAGHSVMLAAGDTYRAAAVEQLTACTDRRQYAWRWRSTKDHRSDRSDVRSGNDIYRLL